MFKLWMNSFIVFFFVFVAFTWLLLVFLCSTKILCTEYIVNFEDVPSAWLGWALGTDAA